MMNITKIYTKFLCVCISVLVLFSCSSDESDEKLQLAAPLLMGSSLQNNAKDVEPPTLTVELTFDQNVTTPAVNHSLVTINGGATLGKVSSNLTKATIVIDNLQKGGQYELVIPEGVILGPTKVAAAKIAIAFSTVAEPVSEPISETLCTSNPMSQAKKVYDYLREIHGQKTLSGSMANVSWNTAEAELIYKATGKYPAIAFFDYIHLSASPTNWIDYSDIKVVEDWWNEGGLVGAGWHWIVPVSETSGLNDLTYDPAKTTFRASNATVEGTWENKIVQADLSKIASYLKLLQDKQIPVIWRPLHEAAGNIFEYTGGTAWFWWGADGADAYKKLWIYMFDYFKNQNINNLIWVWTSQLKDNTFYPGDKYVDIIGRDIYNKASQTDIASQYNVLRADYSNKLTALSECGSVANISNQWSAGARWSFFMPWYQYNATTLDGHEHADTAWWQDAMKQSYVVSRADLPSMK